MYLLCSAKASLVVRDRMYTAGRDLTGGIRGLGATEHPREKQTYAFGGRRVEEGRGAGILLHADPFPFPAHQTGRARFEHPAFRQTSPTSSRKWPQMHIAEPAAAQEPLGPNATQPTKASQIARRPVSFENFSSTPRPATSDTRAASEVFTATL